MRAITRRPRVARAYSEREEEIIMAKKTHKSLSTRGKGLIGLAILLALTIFVSVIAVGGMKLDAEGVNILLPWVPVSSANWPKSLPLSRTLGGGTYAEYTVTPAEGQELSAAVQQAVATMNKRLDGMVETDRAVKATGDNTVRVELRGMKDENRTSILSMATMPGRFEFLNAEGTSLLTGASVKKATAGYNSTGTAYVLTLEFTKEAQEILNAQATTTYTINCDGSRVSSVAAYANGKMTVSMGTDYNTISNVVFLLNTGAFDATLTAGETGEINASAASALTIALVAAAVLMAAAAIYLLIVGKLTGVSAILMIWCSVLLEMFFFATVVRVTLTIGCLIALLLGVVLTVYVAVTRTEAISRQIGEGSAPKNATKLGCAKAAHQVWLAMAGVMVVALLLMIFSATKAFGYTLAAGVVAAAFAAPLMRLFQIAFMAISNKPAMFGKTK